MKFNYLFLITFLLLTFSFLLFFKIPVYHLLKGSLLTFLPSKEITKLEGTKDCPPNLLRCPSDNLTTQFTCCSPKSKCKVEDSVPKCESEWYSPWKYRREITIRNNANLNLNNYQVLVEVNTRDLISAGKMRSDCGDIRFVTDTPETDISSLNYWIEDNTCNTNTTRIWVKLPLIVANSFKNIYLYYGNPQASSISDAEKTMTSEYIYSYKEEPGLVKEIKFEEDGELFSFANKYYQGLLYDKDNKDVFLNSLFMFLPSLSLSTRDPAIKQEVKQIINSILKVKKNEWANSMENLLRKNNTNILYQIQVLTNNFLIYAYNERNLQALDGLADIYRKAYNHLSLDPVNGEYKWINENGKENVLISSQFLYAVSRTINYFLDLVKKNPALLLRNSNNIRDLIEKAWSVNLQHYKRWIFSNNRVFEVASWGCNSGIFNHKEFLEKKLIRAFGTSHNFSYCNAVTDTDLWIMAGTIEMLSAYQKALELLSNPQLPSNFYSLLDSLSNLLTEEDQQNFISYLQIGIELVKSRLNLSNLKNFEGMQVLGLNFDEGAWYDHPEYRYSGYGEEVTEEEVKNMPEKRREEAKETIGWDISHARRFVNVFETFFENKQIIDQSFPDLQVMQGLANQFIYGAFNKDLNNPLFYNYMDGTNGWYVSGSGPTYYGPYRLSFAGITGGYAFWAKYNPDISRVMDAIWNKMKKTYLLAPIKSINSERFKKVGMFDGANNYLYLGEKDKFQDYSGITVEAWVYRIGPTTYNRVISKFWDGSKRNWYLSASNTPFFTVFTDTGGQTAYAASGGRIENNKWYHLVGTWDSKDQKVRLYLNGIEAASQSAPGTKIANNNAPVLIGLDYYAGEFSHGFNGYIDDVRIYNRALTRDEIAAHYLGRQYVSPSLIVSIGSEASLP